MTMYRQGDVLIVSVKEIPQEAAKLPDDNGRTILAYGEVTGHAHALKKDEATLYAANDNTFLRVVSAEAWLRHEEHDPIYIPAGNYRVIRQREYDDSGEIRYVAD